MKVFKKGDMYKTIFSSSKFATKQEALDWLEENGHIDKASSWSPLDSLRGTKLGCDCDCDPCECINCDCECDPCECSEWKSVDEI